MDIYRLAGKIVGGVALAIAVNKITPHVEAAAEDAVAKVKKTKSETSK